MKQTLLKVVAYIVLYTSPVFLTSCPETEPAPQNGTVSFFIKTDFKASSIKVTFDNEDWGDIKHYHPSGILCGESDVNVKKAGGTYSWKAVSSSGTTWSGSSTIVNGNCKTQELVLTSTNTGTGTGTGTGNSTCKGTWVVNPSYLQVTTQKTNRCGSGGLDIVITNKSNTTLTIQYAIDKFTGLSQDLAPGKTIASYSCTSNPVIKVAGMPSNVYTYGGCPGPF